MLDDFGAERNTSFAYEKMFEFIDTRYRKKRPLIITTNMTPDEFVNCDSIEQQRINDRIIQNAIPVLIDGKSMRKETAKENMDHFMELVGMSK